MKRRMTRTTWVGSLVCFLGAGCGGGTAGTPDARDAIEAAGDFAGAEDPDSLEPGPDVGDVVRDEAVADESGADPGGEDVTFDPGTPPEVLDLIAEGKRWLRDGEPAFARKSFEAALDLAPDHTDALFGLALSHLVYGSELAVMAVSIGGQLSDPEASAASTGTPPDTWSQNEYLAAELHYIFMNLRKHFALGSDLLARVEGRPLAFEVEAVPVSLGIKPTVMFRGVFDEADAHVMRAVADTAAGVLDVLAGQDLSTDVLTIVGLVQDGFDDVDGRAIFGILAYLLNEDARFLTPHPEDGETLFEDARRRFGDAGRHLAAAIEALRVEGPSGKGVTWWEPDADEGGTLHVCCQVRRAADGAATEEEMTFGLTADILAAFRDASESIRTPGHKVTLHGAVLPILATMVSLVSQTGFLEGIQVSLPIDLGGFEIAGISALLGSLLPNVVAFDWGAFFEHPVGLRAWLPEVTHGGQGGLTDTVIAEWECPGDLDENGFPSGTLGLLCAKEADLEDGPHFAGGPFEVGADGVASPVPVLAFSDPTLNHLIHVDLGGVPGGADASSYEPADLRSLNAALARLLAGVLSLIPSD